VTDFLAEKPMGQESAFNKGLWGDPGPGESWGWGPRGWVVPGAAAVAEPELLSPIGDAKSLISVIYSSRYKCARMCQARSRGAVHPDPGAGPRASCPLGAVGPGSLPTLCLPHALVWELGSLRERGVLSRAPRRACFWLLAPSFLGSSNQAEMLMAPGRSWT